MGFLFKFMLKKYHNLITTETDRSNHLSNEDKVFCTKQQIAADGVQTQAYSTGNKEYAKSLVEQGIHSLFYQSIFQ